MDSQFESLELSPLVVNDIFFDEFEWERMDMMENIELDFHGTEQRLRSELIGTKQRLRSELIGTKQRLRSELIGTKQRLLSELIIKVKLLELNAKAKKEVSDSPAAAKHIRQTSIRLVKEAQQVLEDFNELEKRCHMLMGKTAWEFPQISGKIGHFKEMCSQFNLEFQQTLAKMLPSLREGGQEEAALAEILNKRHSSPFNSEVLKKWIRWKEREIYTVNFFTNMMINTEIVPWQYYIERERLNVEHVVCFVFTSLGASEPYLSALSHYLNRTDPDEPQDPHSEDVEKDQWFASKEITDEMRHKATLFRDFTEANKEKKNMKFLTLGLTNETLKGSSIYLYRREFFVSENFEPPSKPEAVTVSDINHNSVTLKISPPRFGADNVDFYCVEYRVHGDDAWQQKKASIPEEVTVSGLRQNTEYEFRCRAETSAWVGPHSDVSDSVRTKMQKFRRPPNDCPRVSPRRRHFKSLSNMFRLTPPNHPFRPQTPTPPNLPGEYTMPRVQSMPRVCPGSKAKDDLSESFKFNNSILLSDDSDDNMINF